MAAEPVTACSDWALVSALPAAPADRSAGVARSEAIKPDMVDTKLALLTDPVPAGSSVDQIESAPAFWKTAGGFFVAKAALNCAWLMLPDPLVSIESNKLDIFSRGEYPAPLAPDMACIEVGAPTPTADIDIYLLPVIDRRIGSIHCG